SSGPMLVLVRRRLGSAAFRRALLYTNKFSPLLRTKEEIQILETLQLQPDMGMEGKPIRYLEAWKMVRVVEFIQKGFFLLFKSEDSENRLQERLRICPFSGPREEETEYTEKMEEKLKENIFEQIHPEQAKWFNPTFKIPKPLFTFYCSSGDRFSKSNGKRFTASSIGIYFDCYIPLMNWLLGSVTNRDYLKLGYQFQLIYVIDEDDDGDKDKDSYYCYSFRDPVSDNEVQWVRLSSPGKLSGASVQGVWVAPD
ncbi:MAG: hypothetical protein EZS28_043401, partial [Streblomastix strix]